MELTAEDKTSVSAFLRHFWLSLAILVLVAVFMTKSLQQIAANRFLEESLKKTITEQVAANAGARVSAVRYQYSGEKLQVMAEVLTPQEIDSQQVAQIEKTLRSNTDPNIDLIVRSMISRDFDRSGYVYITEDEKASRFEQNQKNLFLSRVSGLIKKGLTQYPGSNLVDVQNVVENKINKLNAVIRTPSEFTPEQVAALETYLTSSLKEPVHLTIRSIITRDADSTRYLYNEKEASQLSGDALLFHTQLEKALTDELKAIEPAANLLEFNYARQDDNLVVVARIRTPVVFGPERVKQLEKGLQNKIDSRIRLVIRSVLGADSTADWYLGNYNDPVLDMVTD